MKALLLELGASSVTLTPAGGGVFEISVDGALKFSKKSLGRFPDDEEIGALIASHK